MNEQVINDLYNRAVSNGYKKSREEFISLIQTNDSVLNDMYSYVQSKGYGKGVEDFSVLVGKKKSGTGLSTASGISALPSGEKDTLLEETFGKNALTNWFGDIYRSYEAGSSKVENVDPTMNIFGKKASEIDEASLQEFIRSYDKLANAPVTDEMRQYQKEVQEAGGGFTNSIIQAVKNPAIIPQLVVDSFSMLIPITDEGVNAYGLGGAAAGGLVGAGTGAALGAIGGPLAPATSTIGAIAGGLRGAMAGMSATTEVALSYGQFLKEEADKRGLEFNSENVKKLLEDENVVNNATNRALSRGATIGLVDVITSGLAGKAFGATKAAVKGTTGKALGVGAALGIESVGEGFGEGAAQVVSGQEISGEEIALEMLGGIGGGVFNVAVENLIGNQKVGRYKINGEEVSKNRLNKFLETATPDQVANTNIEILDDNDALLLAEDKKKEALISTQIDPAVTDEADKSALIKLEKERANLKGKDTKSAQNRVKAIDEEIDSITGKYTLEVKEEGASYKIDGSKMDRARFVAAVSEAKNEDALNELETTDPEVQKVIDAKRAELTGEVRPEVGVAPLETPETVVETVEETQPDGITKENIKEKIAENNNKSAELRDKQKKELEELNKRENKNYADAFDILNVNEYSQDQTQRSQDAIDLANRHEKEFNDLLQEKRNIESEAEKLNFSNYNLTDKNKLDRLRESINSVFETNRGALDEGFEASVNALEEANSVGASDYVAHGMGKTNLANAYNDLINLFNKGINPIRGRGSLDVAPLSGGVSTGTTASGNAYMDGPFTLVANRNHSGPITNIDQVGGIIVNEGIATDEVLNSLRDLFPNLAIESTSNTKKLVEQLNSRKEEVAAETQPVKTSVADKYTIDEVERVKALPIETEDGATMNLDGTKYEKGGVVIPLASRNLPISELTPEKINDFVEENSEAIGSDLVKVGIYKFPGRAEASIDINIVADKSKREEALQIARELGQESIFDLDTFENIKTGADGKNPKVLSPKEFLAIQERLSRNPEVTITPETSSNYANMTEDNEGNFVFFHVGNNGYETIKTGTGNAPVTSREEASALSKVGGLAMYYTGAEQGERQSAQGSKYAVKVPKEKVYDFNTDKLNLIEEAKQRHESENPGKAFDINSQIAYVTKIAGERGFDMVVAEWAGGTRAQTTKELTPVDVEESTGNVVKKKFSEKYKSNKEKGFKSVVPVRKADKLQKVYDKINETRNAEKRYDDLYRLYTDSNKYTQQEITDLINKSDLSQELKDEYNTALESKEETRRSEKKATLPENVEESIQNSAKTLQTSFPGVKVIVAENISDAKKKIVDQLTPIIGLENAENVAEQMETARGQAVSYNGKPIAVIVNKETAISNTAAHEVWHLILRDAFGRDVKKFKSFQNAIARELKNAGYTDVAEYLDNFTASYEGDAVYEEYLAELGGLLTTKGFDPKNLTVQEKSILNKIKDIINKFAKSIIGKDVFLKDAKPENILQFMIDVSDLVAKGEDVRSAIGKGKAKTGKGVESSLQANFSDKESKLTFIYDRNSEKFEKLKRDGFINDDVSISDFNGKTMLLHQPDAAFSGEIQKNGETIVEGKGGIFFPAKFHEDLLFWAGTKNTISQFVNSLNKISKSNGGKIYMALTSAPYHKLLSSTTMSNALVDFFSSKIVDKNFKISEDQLKSSLVDAAKHKATKKITNKKTGKVSYKEVGLKINLSENDSIESIKSKIAEKLGPDNSNFDDRKLFAKQLIKLMANQINKNEVSVASFGKLFSQGIQNKYFKGITKTGKIKISAANMEQALSEMFTEPMLKEGFNDRSLGGEVYAIIEVDGEVEAVNTDKHESYPVAVKAKNPVKIHILKDRVNWYDVFNKEGETGGIKESERTSVYPTTGVSTSGLQLNIPGVEVSQQKQLPARVNEQINNIISEQKALGNKPVDIAREAAKYLKSTEAYKKLGDRDKAKVLSGVKRLSGMRVKVLVDEYAALKDQLRAAEKLSDANKKLPNYKQALSELVNSVRALAKSGKISTFRAGVIIGRISKTNLASPESVNKTINYVADIFDNANLAMKVSRAKALVKNAKRNIQSKIGQNPDLFNAAKVLVSIDPHFIPTPMIDDYLDIMEVIGERARVLSIKDAGDLTAKMNVIINAVINESESEVISGEEAKVSMTPQETRDAAESLIKQITADKLETSNIVDPNDAAVARNIASITESDMRELLSEDKDGIVDFSKLKLLLGIRENIKSGIVTHEAMVLATTVAQNRNKNQLLTVVNKTTGAKLLNGVTRSISKIKGAITGRSGVLEAIRSTPLEFIDDVIGNFNDKTVHRLTFGILGSPKGKLDARLANLAAKADAAEKFLQAFGRTDNAVVEVKYKIMALQLQREFESNPGSPSVAPAIEFIDATLRAITRKESSLTNNDARILQKIRKDFGVKDANGNQTLDIKAIENSLTVNDKKAMALIDEINSSSVSEALFTSAVIRGNRVNIINNYVHHSVLSRNHQQEAEAIINRLLDRGANGKPSTKAGTLNERTPGAKAIIFDPIFSSMRGARETLTDYYMTPAIREVTGSLNKLKDSVFDDPNSTQDQKDVAQALVDSVQESLEITFQNHFSSDTNLEALFKAIQKLGYQATLASMPRAFAELSSNMSFAILSDPKTTIDALKYTKFAFSTDLLGFLEKIGSAESTRLGGNQTLTGKYAEGGFAAGYGRTSKSSASSKVMDYASFITRMTIGKAYRVADVTSDLLISTPDKVVSRAYYVADFINNFEKETGIRLTNDDLKKISEGTSEYLSPKYESAIQKARQVSDSDIVRMAASGNSFNTILKNVPRKTDSSVMSAYRAINSFMSRFYLTEYGTLRSAVIALFKSGEIDKKAAAAIIAASVTRMSMYIVAYSLLSSIFDSMLAEGLDLEEEEEDKEDILTKMKRSIVGTGVGVLSRRTLGNLGYMPVAFGVEQLNADLGEDFGLRDEEYDPFKNSLVYSKISESDLQTKSPIEVMGKAFAGPLAPMLSSIARAGTLYGRATKEGSEQKTKNRAMEELQTRMAFEAAGNLGLIPFYKDARRILLNDFYARNYDKKDASSFTITQKQIDLVRKSNPTVARQLQSIYDMQKAQDKKVRDLKKKIEGNQTKSN
jgi:hypothetical protein